jgi:PBP1b-binding outer membrane lipoprotein LpoB
MNRAIIILVLVLFTQSCSDNPIEVQELKWNCEYEKECEVTFQLINRGSVDADVQFAIRAHKRTRIQNAIRNEVVGEKKGKLLISPIKVVDVKERIKTNGKTFQIVVSAWTS